jgi:aminoglycoside 3-N-acetyltransferase
MPSGWLEFEEFDTSDPVCDFLPPNCFEEIAEAFLASGLGVSAHVGKARTALYDGAALASFAISWLEQYPRGD